MQGGVQFLHILCCIGVPKASVSPMAACALPNRVPKAVTRRVGVRVMGVLLHIPHGYTRPFHGPSVVENYSWVLVCGDNHPHPGQYRIYALYHFCVGVILP